MRIIDHNHIKNSFKTHNKKMILHIVMTICISICIPFIMCAYQSNLDTSLLIAINSNDSQAAEYAILKGADINVKESWSQACRRSGWTSTECWQSQHSCALALALSEGHRLKFKDTKIALMLIKHGASIDMLNAPRQNILAMVVRHENFDKELLNILLNQKHLKPVFLMQNTATNNQSLWEHALYENNIHLIEALLESGMNPNSTDLPLARASYDGNLEIMKCLLKAGAYPNPPKNYHSSFLHCVCDSDYEPEIYSNPDKHRVQCVNLLLSYGADINIRDKNNQTPIDVARKRRRFDLVNAMVNFSQLHSYHSRKYITSIN